MNEVEGRGATRTQAQGHVNQAEHTGWYGQYSNLKRAGETVNPQASVLGQMARAARFQG